MRWSDGYTLSASDIAFTFHLMKKHAALDARNVWQFLADVRRVSDLEVTFTFTRPHVPGFFDIAIQSIVPAHIWEAIDDPARFPNERPVGTGPFTEVTVFRDQVYEIRRNPFYWQKGKPLVAGLRMPAFSSNEQVLMALMKGEIDWAGAFVPDVENTFVAKDPVHHAYWYPSTEGTVFLYLNTKRPPFSETRVRKALSMAIDRTAIAAKAMHGYTQPADATGLSLAYDSWRHAPAVKAGSWVQLDRNEARRLLDEAGLLKSGDGPRRDSQNVAFQLEINTVTGWSDWLAAADHCRRPQRCWDRRDGSSIRLWHLVPQVADRRLSSVAGLVGPGTHTLQLLPWADVERYGQADF